MAIPNKPKSTNTNPYELTQDCVVLVCSGPSLNKVDPFSLGYPVVAISTAIRAEAFKNRKPDVWILADRLNDMHAEKGQQLWRDPEVLKVMPEVRRKDINRIKNLKDEELPQWYFCGYDNARSNKRRKKQEPKEVFNGNMPFWRGPHKSVTFGLQWCHYMGAKTIIWAGCDLTATSIADKYAYEIEGKDKKKQGGYLRTLNVVQSCLKNWYPIAQERGFEWYNWKCGEVLGEFLPPFIGKGTAKKIIVSVPAPPKERPEMKHSPQKGRGNRVSRKPVRKAVSKSRARKNIRTKQNKGEVIFESPKVGKGHRSPPGQQEIYDDGGRHISEPFVNVVDNNYLGGEFLDNVANLPEENPINVLYVEDVKERKQKQKEVYQKIKLRNLSKKKEL